jgi:hypothetical protein
MDLEKLEDEMDSIQWTYDTKGCIESNQLNRLLHISYELLEVVHELENEKIEYVKFNQDEIKKLTRMIKQWENDARRRGRIWG